MPYGTIKVDNITFDNGGTDKLITVSGLFFSTSGALTVTGTISGGNVTAPTATFTTLTGTTTAGTTATFTSGSFTSLTGVTTTVTSGVFSSGIATAPSVAIGSGTTYKPGIYSPGVDQVAISTNGTGRLFVDSSGRSAMGTGSPETGCLLTFQESASLSTAIALKNRNSTQTWKVAVDGSAVDDKMLAFIDNTTLTVRMALTDTGRLGIGTTSPSQTLHVENTNLTNPSLTWGASATQTIRVSGIRELALGVTGAAPYDCYLQARNNASAAQALLLNPAGGNVGIGTSGPQNPLVVSNAGANGFEVSSATNSGTTSYLLSYNRSTSAYTDMRFDASAFRFEVSASEKARIDTSGRLLVGTSSYDGNARAVIQGNTSSNTTGALVVRYNGTRPASAGEGIGSIRFESTSQTSSNYHYASISCDTDGASTSDTDIPGRLVFSTTADGASGPTERMRIDSSGRLLVGTSSAPTTGLYAQYAPLTVRGYIGSPTGNGIINIASGSAASAIASGGDIGTLVFSESSGGEYVRISCFTDATGGTNDYPGRLVFSTTADGAASPTERIRIGSNGYFKASNTGSYVYSTLNIHEFASNQNAQTLSISNSFASYTDYMLLLNASGSTSGTGYSFIRCDNSSGNMFNIFGNGNATNVNNSYGAISDVKLKENIVNSGSQWNDIKALQVRKYNFKEGQTHTQIGLVAQEVELVSPGLVGESPDRDAEGNDLGTVTKSVNYSVLYMKAVKALQEAMERIETLEASNADILTRLSALEAT